MEYEWSRVEYGWSTSGVGWSRNSWSVAFSPLGSAEEVSSFTTKYGMMPPDEI